MIALCTQSGDDPRAIGNGGLGSHGIGPRQAAALCDYGVHSVGLFAAISPATVQRLLGGRPGRSPRPRRRPAPGRPPRCPPPPHSLDTARESRLVSEAAIDRVRDEYGPDAIGPAAFRHAS
ncbi:hypothetical protein [Streptomyces massasporeus]|nr:hypothetical protein [Streptomyces massasporeus]GGV87327.1 hypothetical protein GCM10010228_69380 [Streptomyces massasporeus]